MTPGKVWVGLSSLILATVVGVVSIEGGFSNDPDDAGGATNHGITEAVAREGGYEGAMQSLPEGLARQIYIDRYILAPKFDQVLALSPAVGTELIDTGVNVGPSRATTWFQQTLNDLSRGGRDYARIGVDGRLGSQTLAAYRMLERKRGRVKACELTLKLLDSYQSAHYARLAQGQANASFLVGWVDHRIGNVPLARCSEVVTKDTQ